MAPSADDLKFMAMALDEARLAEAAGEVPVGAIAVREGIVVGAGHNCPISTNDPSAHAEIVALRAAGAACGGYRMAGLTIYVTLEPCVMCVGAMLHARVARLVYGSRDDKAGALGSVYDIGRDGRLNHRLEVYSGVLEEECAMMLRAFFRSRRASN